MLDRQPTTRARTSFQAARFFYTYHGEGATSRGGNTWLRRCERISGRVRDIRVPAGVERLGFSMISGCRICESLAGPGRLEPIFEDDVWHVRHAPPPYSVAGWMMMIARRHVPGPAHFDDSEARSFGFALRHFERVLERVTGALRIYTAALGESSPHFHAHLVPRYATMPKEAVAWGVFDLERAAKAGEISVDFREVERVIREYRLALSQNPM